MNKVVFTNQAKAVEDFIEEYYKKYNLKFNILRLEQFMVIGQVRKTVLILSLI